MAAKTSDVPEGGFVFVEHSDANGSTSQESPEMIRKIKKWLNPTDSDSPASEYRKHLVSHVQGTGEWILETGQYRDWFQSESVGNLWIRGIPGCGKSVVAANFTSRLQRLDDGPVLFFFFREIIQTNRSPRSLLQDFCHKLLDYSPYLQSDLKQHLEKFSAVESVPFETLWGSLSNAMRFMKKVYCVVDALDEMEQENDQFLEDLLNLGRQSPRSIKLIVTSRQVPHLEKHMSGSALVDLRLDRRNVDRDISTFITRRLEDSKLKIPRDEIENIKRSICERGKGLFLYARLMLDQLLLKPEDIASRVDNLPDGLGDMYTNLLHDYARRSGTSTDFQRLVLQWITHSARPLRLLELASMIEALPDRGGLDPDCNVKLAIRTACGPLLEVCEDGVVQIIHHSLTEFILNRDVEHTQMANQSREFAAVDSPAVHGMIARACIRYLSSGCLQQWDIEHHSRSDRTALLLQHYFLKYATSEWPFHVNKAADSDTDLLEFLEQFCHDGSKDYEAWKDLWHGDHEDISRDCSPLHIVAYCGLLPFARYLLSKGADPNSEDAGGKTPLVYAVMKGHDEMVSLLLQHHADHDIRVTYDGIGIREEQPLVHYACKLNHVQVLCALIHGGADAMAKDTECHGHGKKYYCEILDETVFYHSCQKNRTALAIACQDGHVDAVRELMKHVDSSCLGDGYLHLAAKEGHAEVVTALLQHENVRLAINERDSEGNTPLYLAARRRSASTIQVLLNHGADIHVLSMNRNSPPEPPQKEESAINPVMSPSYTPLHGCAIGVAHEERGLWWIGDMEFGYLRDQDLKGSLEILLEAGCDINARDHRGRTVLFWWPNVDGFAMRKDEFIALLLNHGADGSVIDYNGASPLHPNRSRIWEKSLELLVNAGAEINWGRKIDGKTPLMLTALEQNHIDPTLFHERGADFDKRDYLGNTALHHYFRRDPAGEPCYLDTWLSLSDLHLQNNLGRTPLHEFMYRQGGRWKNDELQLLVEMLKSGASLESRDGLGRTSLLIALVDTKDTSLKLVDELLKLGADARAIDYKGKSALHYAFKPFREEYWEDLDVLRQVAQRLIDCGANMEAIDHDGNTIFHDMISHKPIDGYDHWQDIEKRAKMVIELGGPFKQANHQGRTALHVAAAMEEDHGHTGMGRAGTRLEFLLHASKGFNVNARDHDGLTALHLASGISDTNAMTLIQHGADVHAKDCRGSTPLHFAARSGQSNVVGLLTEIYLQQSISVDDVCLKRRSALHEASRSGCLEAVKLLLEAGANPSLRDERGRTALHAAAEFQYVTRARRTQYRYDDGLSLLVAQKTSQRHDWKRQEQKDALSLMELEISDEEDCRWIRQVVRSLMAAGADPQQRDDNGHRPFDVAVMLGCAPVVDELRRTLKESELQSLDPLSGPQSALNGTQLHEMIQSVQVPADQVRFLERVFATGDDCLAEELVRTKALKLVGDDKKSALFLLARWGLTSMMERLLPYVEDSAALIPSLLDQATARSLCNLEMVRFLAKRLSKEHKHLVYTTAEAQGVCNRGRGGYRGRVRRGGGPAHHVPEPPVATHPLAEPLLRLSTGRRWWYPKALSVLIEAGVNTNKSFRHDHTNMSPLKVALSPHDGTSGATDRYKWNNQVLEILLEHGADLNHIETERDRTPLIAAISEHREIEIIQLLIDHGASVSLGSPPPIIEAIWGNDPAIIELLLKAGADPNGTEDDDCPLIKAAQRMAKDSKATSLLLQYGADPLRPTSDGTSTVFHEICSKEHFLQHLLAAGVDPNIIDGKGRTPLMRTCDDPWSGRHVAAVKLIEAGADIHAVDHDGSTALHHAAKFGNLDIVQELLKRAALVSTRNREGKTPLCCALDSYTDLTRSRTRFSTIIHALLDAGADPRQTLPDGRTALHCIAVVLMDSSNVNREAQIERDCGADRFSESTKLYERFLSAGCDREARDNEGNTPIFHYVAAEKPRLWCNDEWPEPPNPEDYKKMFAELDVHKINNYGDTLLHTIARRELCEFEDDGEELFSALVDLGLSPWRENKQGHTPLDIAATSGKKNILALFARDE